MIDTRRLTTEKELNLSKRNINDTTLKDVVEPLITNKYLKTLILSGNPFTDASVPILKRLIEENDTIET